MYEEIIFLIQPLLRKGLHIDSLEIREIFWDVKAENEVFGKIQKTLDKKRSLI